MFQPIKTGVGTLLHDNLINKIMSIYLLDILHSPALCLNTLPAGPYVLLLVRDLILKTMREE
jgi:hypothetical protein